jgi:DnaJ family protein C protein 19
MTKFIIVALVLIVLCRIVFKAWPWQLWHRSQLAQSQAQARTLLNVSRFASREDILAAHRRALRDAHPDRGGSSDAVHRIDTARDLLLEQTAREPHQ